MKPPFLLDLPDVLASSILPREKNLDLVKVSGEGLLEKWLQLESMIDADVIKQVVL
jgi:hypothetical protein